MIRLEKQTAPKWQGIVAVAAIFGIVGGGVAFVMYDFSFVGAVVIAGIVAALVCLLLVIGWQEPARRGTVAPGSAGMTPGQAGQGPGAAPAPSDTDLTPNPPRPSAEKTSAAAPSPAPAPTATGTEARFDSAASAAPAAATATPSATAAPADTRPVAPDGKPELLDAPRGEPDNLKQIKGVGPKLETMLHGMGIYHFDQIASWRAKEVAWVDQNLEGFKGRVSRDDWVKQAKILAEGGSTEFSGKVKKGDVY